MAFMPWILVIIYYVTRKLDIIPCLCAHTRLLKAHTKLLEAHTRLLEAHTRLLEAHTGGEPMTTNGDFWGLMGTKIHGDSRSNR